MEVFKMYNATRKFKTGSNRRKHKVGISPAPKGKDESPAVNVVDLEIASFEISSNQELPSGSNQRGSISKPPVNLAWEGVTCTVRTSWLRCQKGGKILLANVTGMAEGGKIQALMGPSGSGKTTLLDILADRMSSTEVTGKIMINGVERNTKSMCDTFRKLSCYVDSEDAFYEILTVEETLRFTASLVVKDKQIREESVERCLTIVGLQSCRHTKIGGYLFRGLSTGQKRRVSIALGLLKDPLILFLDEPLSGLDGTGASKVMGVLSSVAKRNKVIIMSVHQPPSRVWESFDTLTLLSQGLLLYSGPIQNAMPMLERTSGKTFPQNCNPADFMLDLINHDFEHDEEARNNHRKTLEIISAGYFSSEIHESVKNGIRFHCETVPLSQTDTYHAGFFAQTYHLTKRALWNHTVHPGFYWVKLAVYILLDFVIASIYNRSQSIPDVHVAGLLYFVQSILVLLTIAGLPALILIRPVFTKERANGLLDTAPYVIATFLSMTPWVLSAAVLSGVIISLIVDLNNFLWLIAILSATLLCAESMINLIASITDQFIVGLAIAAGIYGAFMINTGFILPHHFIPEEYSFGKLIHHVSFHKYSFRSMLFNEFRDEKYYREPQFYVTCQDINAEFSHGGKDEVGYSGELSVCNSGVTLQKSSHMLQLYHVEGISLVNDMGILIGYIFILQLIIFIVTYSLHTGRR